MACYSIQYFMGNSYVTLRPCNNKKHKRTGEMCKKANKNTRSVDKMQNT